MSTREQETARTKEAVSFGPFRLAPRVRLLERAGETVPLGGRALDILIVLLEHAGEVVSKKDLIERVWPDVTVTRAVLDFMSPRCARRSAMGRLALDM